jgi:hypothetical protein
MLPCFGSWSKVTINLSGPVSKSLTKRVEFLMMLPRDESTSITSVNKTGGSSFIS